MSEKTGPVIPGTFSEGAPKHSLRTRMSRIRRVHLVLAGSVLVVLVAGVATWAAVGNGSTSPDATGPGPALAAPTSGAGSTPQGSEPAAVGSSEVTPSPAAGGVPVPTWTPAAGGRGGADGRSGQNRQVAGMPTDLKATRDGDTVVLEWKDNTNNEDGFALFVSQGWTTYQINVPAGTTRYAGITAARNTRTCFAVVPFTWTGPMAAYPTGGWACTDSRRS